MPLLTGNDFSALYDDAGRWVFALTDSANYLPTSGVPEGSLAWDNTSQALLAFSSGSWGSASPTLGAVIGTSFTGDVTGDLTGEVIHNDNVRSKRVRVTLAQLNAGATLLAAVAGYGYRIIDFTMIAVGGALGTATSIEIEGNQGGAVDLFSVAAAQLAQSAVNKPGIAGTTVLADGASFAVCSDNTAITISATGTADTLTNVDVILTYTLET